MKTTSKYCLKRYLCAHCSTNQMIGTNHYGEVYSACQNPNCVSNRPMINATYRPPRHICMEDVPEGMGVPEPWKVVNVGDVITGAVNEKKDSRKPAQDKK